MKVQVEDSPVKDAVNGGYFGIRLIPETVEEVAQLERPFVVEIQAKGFQRIIIGDKVTYLVEFESYNRSGDRGKLR